MRNVIWHAVARYSVATALVIAVMAIKSMTDFLWGNGPPLILFLSAVMSAARFCGWDAGIATTFVSALVCMYFYFEPSGSILVHNTNDAFRLGVFLLEGITLSTLMQSLQLSRKRAEQTARLLLLKERAFRETEERLNLLVDGVQDYAMIMLDPAGHVMSWNPGAERIKGYRSEEIVGRHFSCFFRPEDLTSGRLEELLKTVASGKRFQEEGWRLRKDGSAFWANVIMSAAFDETGQLKGFSKVTRDVTARRQVDRDRRNAAEELVKAQDKALETSRAKSEFLANMSHEIRTHMDGVLGMTELVLDTDLTREQRDSMEHVRSSAESLTRVLNSIQQQLDQTTALRVAVVSKQQTCAYDRATALANLEDDEDLLAEIISLFLDHLAARLDEVRCAIDDSNCDQLYRSAHSLRGSASNFAAKDFASVAMQLEESAQQNDIRRAAETLAEFEQEAARLAIELSSDPALKSCEEIAR